MYNTSYPDLKIQNGKRFNLSQAQKEKIKLLYKYVIICNNNNNNNNNGLMHLLKFK